MEIFLAGALTWLVACFACSFILAREFRAIGKGFDQERYLVALRYKQWISGARQRIKQLPQFLASPLVLSLYMGRKRTSEQVKEHVNAAIQEAQNEMRLRYSRGVKWLHPADLYQYQLEYLAWFQESQKAQLRKVQSQMRFRMYARAGNTLRQFQPCSCPQPLRNDVGSDADTCTCGGLLPKDPASFVL